MKTARAAFFAWCCILLCLLAVDASRSYARQSSVRLFRAEDDRLWYINGETMVNLPSDIVSFWNRVVPRKGSAHFRQMQSVLKQAGKDPRRLEFYQRLDEMDCMNNRLRTVSELYYDENDRILLSRVAPRAGWTAIAAGSDEAFLRETVCSGTATADTTAAAYWNMAME